MCMSHPSTLKHNNKVLKIYPGGDPNRYLLCMYKVKISMVQVIGRIMMDEIKLINGILYNPSNNEVTGFVTKQLNTTNLLQIIMCGQQSTDDKSQLSVYTNQWRLTHNSDFYYNTGSLDGNKIVGQCMDVMISYENLEVKIFGLVCYGGGGNSKFIRLQRVNLPGSRVWPDADSNCWPHPLDSKRYV